MHLVDFIIRIYHDARSLERQIGLTIVDTNVHSLMMDQLGSKHVGVNAN